MKALFQMELLVVASLGPYSGLSSEALWGNQCSEARAREGSVDPTKPTEPQAQLPSLKYRTLNRHNETAHLLLAIHL